MSAEETAPETAASEHQCNICGSTAFEPLGNRQNARCAACKSLERTRLLWMYLERETISPDARILHMAPEPAVYNKLSKIVRPENYVCADIDPARYRFVHEFTPIDLTDLDGWASEEFDLILHIHVLEHIPCNFAYTLFHLHRMLTPTGRHVCIIPFSPGRYDETYQDVGDEERKRRFGQEDHIRRFGNQDVGAHLGKVITLPDEYDVTKEFDEAALRRAHVPENTWRGFTASTVLTLNKNDYRLA